jgi:hypothetical protein
MSQFVFLYREPKTPTPEAREARMAKVPKWFEDLDEAVRLAGACPIVEDGGVVEVRPGLVPR